MGRSMTESELDEHIKSCGVLMEQAYALNLRADAAHWMELQALAIRSRTSEHVARLERERGLAPCFFHEAGERDSEALHGG